MNNEIIIDSHAHLNFKAFESDLKEVIERTLNNNVWAINVGSQYETSEKAVEIAERYEKGIYASVGLHPIHTVKEFSKNRDENNEEIFDYGKYKKLAVSEKVVAIGETGLDYYYKPKNKGKRALFKEKQKNVFLKHLDLSKKLNLPLILHCRMAHQELIEILTSQNFKSKGVVHCFTGTIEDALYYLDMDLYIGFTGIIFKLDLKDIIKRIPLDKLLIETDCPYLSPPGREERNEPLYVRDVAYEIARIKKVDYEEVRKATTSNAKKLFGI